MLKKIIMFLMIIGCINQFSTGMVCYAKEIANSDVLIEEVYEDGSYIESTVILDNEMNYTRATKVSGNKKYSYKSSSGKLLWVATLYGSFTYNGTSAKCTNTSLKVSISDDNWKATGKNSHASGNVAIGEVTTKKYTKGVAVQTISRTLKLTCTGAGKLK